MGTPNTVVKNYHLSHPEMLEATGIIVDLFVLDQPQFITFDPSFGGTFLADWQADIVIAEGYDTDEVILDQMTQFTEVVDTKMDLCRHKFQQSKYFVERAFPDNAGIQNEFGYDDYDAARKNQPLFIQFMRTFHNKADKYKVQLLAVNYTQPMIDEILVRASELETANRSQEAFIRARNVTTQERQLAYNKIWDIVVRVCKAGQLIFHDNAAKYEQYLIPTSSTGGGTAPGTEFINIPVDQTTPDTVTPKIAGKATATGTKQFKLDFGDGNSTIGTVVAGVLTSYPHTYLIPGQYNIKATAITAGALEEFDVLQADNCKLFGTITIPATVQLSGLQVPNNLVTRVLMSPACYAFLVSFILYNNNMDASSVNENLIGLDNSGQLNGIANFGGGTNNAPSWLGIAAKNSLIAKGWTVITN